MTFFEDILFRRLVLLLYLLYKSLDRLLLSTEYSTGGDRWRASVLLSIPLLTDVETVLIGGNAGDTTKATEHAARRSEQARHALRRATRGYS
mgnify:CR=1 FL=1